MKDLANSFLNNNFTMWKNDTTVSTKTHENVNDIYVDNIIYGSINEFLCKEFSETMRLAFEISMIGELNSFLEFKSNKRMKVHSSLNQYIELQSLASKILKHIQR